MRVNNNNNSYTNPVKRWNVVVGRNVSVTGWRAPETTAPQCWPLSGSLAAQGEAKLLAHLGAERLLLDVVTADGWMD
jgi:hypothetical protein